MKKLLVLAGDVPLAVVGITGVAAHAATSQTVRDADLSSTHQEDNATFQFRPDGLRLTTLDQDAYAKGYFSVGEPLANVQTVAYSWVGTDYGTNSAGKSTGKPGIYYNIDLNGDGLFDGQFIGEPAYGGKDVWLNRDTADSPGGPALKDDGVFSRVAPSCASGVCEGGSGDPHHGDLSAWSNALKAAGYPNANVTQGGFLASGLVMDGVLSKVTYGTKEFTFTSSSASVAGPQASDVTGKLIAKQRVHAVEMRFESDQLPAGRVQGAPLRWSVTVNGVKRSTYTLNAGQSASDRVVNHKRRGYKVVRVYKNGVKVATYVVAPRKRR